MRRNEKAADTQKDEEKRNRRVKLGLYMVDYMEDRWMFIYLCFFSNILEKDHAHTSNGAWPCPLDGPLCLCVKEALGFIFPGCLHSLWFRS